MIGKAIAIPAIKANTVAVAACAALVLPCIRRFAAATAVPALETVLPIRLISWNLKPVSI